MREVGLRLSVGETPATSQSCAADAHTGDGIETRQNASQDETARVLPGRRSSGRAVMQQECVCFA
jgi:hypothetical protein